MKHVFTIHSPITFLAAHAVIENLELPIDDVIIFSNGYKVPLNTYSIFPFLANRNTTYSKKLKNLITPKAEDNYISLHTNEEAFIAYIDLMSFFQKVLISHENCKSFNFIEEGNSSYLIRNDLDTLTWDKRNEKFRVYGFKSYIKNIFSSTKWAFRGYTNRFLALPYSYDSYQFIDEINYFTFSKNGFPLVASQKRKVLQIQKSNALLEMSKSLFYRDIVIWVDGSNSKFTDLPETIYNKAIDKAIHKLKNSLTSKKIVIKLRPGIENLSTNYLYAKLNSCGYHLEVMRNDIVLEAVLINSKNCIVVGNLSSALFYASIFGHEAYSIYGLYDQKVKTIFDDMPGYWEHVKKI